MAKIEIPRRKNTIREYTPKGGKKTKRERDGQAIRIGRGTWGHC